MCGGLVRDPHVAPMDEPVHTEFMNEAMLRLWERLGALPGDLRPYGGTALALYRNHRESTGFGFATPRAVVDPQWVRGLSWLQDAVIEGGPGMVDAQLRDGNAQDALTVTFMECGHMIPLPTREPPTAANGVAVAHPVDLVAAKVEACLNRGATRDYVDVAEALGAWPGWCRDEVPAALPERSRSAIGRAFAAPPREVMRELPRGSLRRLRAFARELGRSERGLEL